MNDILLRVLAVVLSGVSPEPLEERSVPFSQLPAECAAVYDAELRQFRQAAATEVISIDLDGDKIDELLIFNGNCGSGGEEWVIMQKHHGQYRKAGVVFGTLYRSGNGLLVESPCGWSYADWNYYELVNGELTLKLDIDVEYSAPVRKNPVNVNIKVK